MSRRSLPPSRVDRDPVDHDLDRVLPFLVEIRHHRVEGENLAIDAHPKKSLPLERLEVLAVLSLAPFHQRGQHLHALPGEPLEHAGHDLVDRLPGDLTAALVAVLATDAGEEEAEVVVDLGSGGDGGARVAPRPALFDGDGRREAGDVVDVGLLHLPQELPSVGGERLDVAALPFGVERVEGKGRFPRAGDPGDHHESIARDGQRDVLQIVLAGSLDGDLMHGAGPFCSPYRLAVGGWLQAGPQVPASCVRNPARSFRGGPPPSGGTRRRSPRHLRAPSRRSRTALRRRLRDRSERDGFGNRPAIARRSSRRR